MSASRLTEVTFDRYGKLCIEPYAKYATMHRLWRALSRAHWVAAWEG